MGREGHTLDAPGKPPRAAPPAIPPLRRVRTTLARAWPLASWLAAIAAAGWLYPRAETHGEALAWPEVVEIGVTPQVAGRLASMPLEIGVEVHDGDLAATLDTTDIDERLRVARAEAARRPGDGGAGRRVVLVEGKGTEPRTMSTRFGFSVTAPSKFQKYNITTLQGTGSIAGGVATTDHLKGSLMLSLESTSSRMSNLARQEMYFHRFFTLDELVERIEEVTAEQIRQIAQTFFDPKQIALTVLGNLDGLKITREELVC